ncbi:hypothetical protein [Clostridium sp. CF012]|uniref:hypothetical protein n=1 Tax=Clostridium sp. CF012 TaxID=2843319 RepID=UPI001C0C2CAE|nr:hypothetical protein [Clostridium sp. CF012]MBU3144130.1 hypothetical protein [Clostridium sp. CF012]
MKGITSSGYYSKLYKDAKEASEFTNSKAYENINCGSLTSSIFLDINNSDAFAYSIHPIFSFFDKYNSYKNMQTAHFSIEAPKDHIQHINAFHKEAIYI